MAKYIDKDALVAEIDRRISDNKKEIERASHKNLEDYFEGYEDALALLKQFLDTLEVKEITKEVDMKVAELIKLFSHSTRYKLIGAKTGLPLYKSWINKNLDKFKDLDVSDIPLEASFQIQRGVIMGEPEYIRPIILIYVSGL